MEEKIIIKFNFIIIIIKGGGGGWTEKEILGEVVWEG